MLGYRSEVEKTDRALNALSHVCRRRLLFELYEGANSGKGESINYTGITSLNTKRERSVLYHTHLPQLEKYGYIKWNKSEKTIQTGPRWGEIEPLLELINSHLAELLPLFQDISANS